MINPSDIRKLDTEEGRKELDPDFVAEFQNGKGSDEDVKKEDKK